MRRRTSSGRTPGRGRIQAFVRLLVFWLIFSGHYDPFHITLGVLCAAGVSCVSHDLLVHGVPDEKVLRKTWRFLVYIPWLIYQVVLANLHVVRLVFVRRDVQPQMVRFKTYLSDEMAQLVFANSITLTPGTITVDVVDGEYCVHAISEKAAEDLLAGEMQCRVGHIFMESRSTDVGNR